MTTEVTRKQAILLSVLCAILVIILFWQFLISPQIKSASKAKEDLETLNQQYSDLLVQSESYDQNMAALDGWNEKNSEETKKLFPRCRAHRPLSDICHARVRRDCKRTFYRTDHAVLH